MVYQETIVTGMTEKIKTIGKAVVPSSFFKQKAETPAMAGMPEQKNVVRAGSSFVAFAGIFGALAVALGGYGAHRLYPRENIEELKNIFETANRYHFIHSLALLGVPLCRWPKLSGTLLMLGTLLFSGTCYYHALTGNSCMDFLAPWGGTLLVCGWLAMIL